MAVDGPADPSRTLRHFDFVATPENVSAFIASLGPLLPPALSQEERDGIEVALGEALMNLVRHGYPAGSGRIQLEMQETGDSLTLELRDWGAPIPADLVAGADGSVFDFDPQDLQALPESGMGLHLMRLVFDELSYVAGPDGNRLVLKKNIRGN